MTTRKFNKFLISLGAIITLLSNAYPQASRVVMVQSNTGALLYPTNFWSINAPSARIGLSLAPHATNPVVSVTNGGSGATTAAGARTNLGLGWTALTNTNAATALLGYMTNGQVVANTGTNVLTFPNQVRFGDVGTYWGGFDGFGIVINLEERKLTDQGVTNADIFQWSSGETVVVGLPIDFSDSTNAATTRANLGFSTNLNTLWTATTAGAVRGALEINTNDSVSFSGVSAPSGVFNDGAFINATFDNEVEFANGFSFGLYSNASAAIARTNLGLGSSWLTNTNVTNFRTSIGLGTTNVVEFRQIYSGESIDVGSGSNYVGLRSNSIIFGNSSIAQTVRTNLGLGWPALTNTNASAFSTALFGTNTNPVLANTNGEVVSPANLWAAAPFVKQQSLTNFNSSATNAATNGRSVYIYSISPTVSGITSTITLPTNSDTLNGDTATVVHTGPASSVTAVRQLGASTNLITLSQPEESVRFVRRSGAWALDQNVSFVEPVQFSGTNATANAAESRTNLGLGWAALTNTNSATSLLGFSSNGVIVANTGTNVLTFTSNISASQIEYIGTVMINVMDGVLQNENALYKSALEWGGFSINVGMPISFFTNAHAAITRANLGFSTNLNTLWTATNSADARSVVGLGWSALTNTNVTNFRTAIGLGATNDVTFDVVRATYGFRVEQGTNQQVYIGDDIVEMFVDLDILSAGGISFEGTNAALAAATTRTNLGLPLPALTNTSNVTMMRALAGSTNTNEPYSGYFEYSDGTDTYGLTFSNGILLKQEGPL